MANLVTLLMASLVMLQFCLVTVRSRSTPLEDASSEHDPKPIFDLIHHIVGGAANAVGNAAGGLFHGVGAVVGGAAHAVGSVVTGVVNGGRHAVQGAVGAVGSVAHGAVHGARRAVDGAAGAVGSVATGVVNGGGHAVQGAEGAVRSVRNGVVDGAGHAVEGAVDAAGSVANGVVNGAGNEVEGAVDAAGSVATRVVHGVGHAVDGAVDAEAGIFPHGHGEQSFEYTQNGNGDGYPPYNGDAVGLSQSSNDDAYGRNGYGQIYYDMHIAQDAKAEDLHQRAENTPTEKRSTSDISSNTDCPQKCPVTFHVVCGSNGKQYLNPCWFKKYLCESGNHDVKMVDCSDCPQKCSLELEVVCASNGHHYLNSCWFKKHQCESGNHQNVKLVDCKDARN